MNNVSLMGRMTRDTELRKTTSGVSVTSFSIAVDRTFKDKESGERQVDFIDCVAWRGLAEFVCKWFSKGSMIALTGSLHVRDWTDKEGNKRRSAEVVANNVYFCGNKSETGGGNALHTEPAAQGVDVDASDFTELTEDDGDLPF